ncbi:MAG: ABC transporter permease [Candidatus Omnitrophica bacterium]|nr:ABC transporter permease [Candidatus Omnitrophota bacterium]
MNYENWITYRYLTASKGRFLSFLNLISVAGVAIGVMALIVVTGIMTGFGNNLREKIIGTTPHVMIEKETGIGSFHELRQRVNAIEGIEDSSAYIQGNVFLESADGQATGIFMRGIFPETEARVTKVDQYLVKGTLEDLAGDKVFIGIKLARYFGYRLGDTITVISPGSGVSGQGWRYQLKVAGIFKTGMADYDLNLVLVHLPKAQAIFGLDENIATGLGVKLKDSYKARKMKDSIYGVIGRGFLIKTWIDINRGLFEALFLEKWGLFIILSLMVIVASFNIISTLIVTVTSKIHDIGILQSIGVPKHVIRRIFTKQGVFIGALGTLWGLAGGVGLSYILKTYVKVPQEIYSTDHVPVELQPGDIAIIVGAALMISYLATIYPAAKAANLQPVEALRYE